MAKVSKLAAKSTELVGFPDKLDSKIRWFFRTRNPNFWKQLSLANLMSNANGTVRFLKTLKSWVFCKKKVGFPIKTSNFSKIANGNKFAVQCEGISKLSQNVQTLGFGVIKENFGFWEKLKSFKMAKAATLP